MHNSLRKILKQHWNKIFLLSVLAILLGYVGFLAHATSQSQRFGDEVGHMIGGHFVLEGQTLYKDLQFNHQPLVYLYSSIVEKISAPQNLYFYIAHQREGIFVYGALWILLFVFMFGYRGLAFGLIFETSKYFFQGNKLLAESLAVYPAAYLLFLLSQIILEKKKPNRIELIIASISLFVITFSLFQLWIFVGVVGLTLLAFVRRNRRDILALIAPGIGLTLGLFSIIPFSDYYRETITNVMNYFVPVLERKATLLSTITFPFTTLIPPYEGTPKITIGIAVLFLMVYFYFLSRKAKLSHLIFITIILWSANTRADNNWFDSFHLLPWFGGLIALLLSYAYYYLHHFRSQKLHITMHVCVLLLVVTWLIFEIPNPIEAKQHIMNENYVNYSYSETVGRAVKIMKNEGDTALVIENDPIIYWVGDVKNATHVLEYYSWVLTIPKYRDEILSLFKTNPPAFVINTGFFNNEYDPKKDNQKPGSIADFLSKEMYHDYVIAQHNNKSLVLYVNRKKLKSINSDQRKELEGMLFHLPEN
jgi:hypothetical protein